jgi:uncharacterized membrane protein YesL
MNGMAGIFYKVSEWIARLAYINFLWLAFTMLGLVVFGFFPAYIAMLSVIRKWIMGNSDVPVFRTFLLVYKKEFLKSNGLGFILTAIGYILYVDLSIVKEAPGFINLTYYPLSLIFLGFILASFYSFPIIVHYDTKIHHALKNSFILMVLSPFSTIMMICGSIAVYLLMTTIPGLLPFFSASFLAFTIMWSALLAFSKIEKRQESSIQEKNTSRRTINA